MIEEHKIGIIAFIYGVLASVVVLIATSFDMATYTFLGFATSMLAYSSLIRSSRKLKKGASYLNITLRMLLFASVLAAVGYIEGFKVMPLVYTLIGLVSSKVGVIIYFLFFKKNKDEEVKEEVENV